MALEVSMWTVLPLAASEPAAGSSNVTSRCGAHGGRPAGELGHPAETLLTT